MPPPSCTGTSTAREDRLDRLAVDRLAGEGAVEIDDMQPAEAGGGEAPRLRRRVVVEHGGARHLAAHQAHAGAVLQIDRGKEDHGASRLAVEALVVEMAGDDLAVDPGVAGWVPQR